MILKFYWNGALDFLYTNVIMFVNRDGYVVNQLVVPKASIRDHIEISIVDNKVIFETDSKVFIFQNVPEHEIDFQNNPVKLHNFPGFNERAYVQFGKEEIRKAHVVLTASGQYKLKIKSGNFWT